MVNKDEYFYGLDLDLLLKYNWEFFRKVFTLLFIFYFDIILFTLFVIEFYLLCGK
jgi:hypothetical protein